MVSRVQPSENVILVGGKAWLSEDIILDGKMWPSEDTIFIGNRLDPFHQFTNSISEMIPWGKSKKYLVWFPYLKVYQPLGVI